MKKSEESLNKSDYYCFTLYIINHLLYSTITGINIQTNTILISIEIITNI